MVALLTAHDAAGHVHLIIGTGALASARCKRSLEVGARPIVVDAIADPEQPYYVLESRISSGEVQYLGRRFQDEDISTLGREEIGGYVDAVFVTSGLRTPLSTHISDLCRRNRVPVNVIDSTNLSSFSILSTYTDGPLQIGISTSGKGCKLASRLRREIAHTLPPNLGVAIERLGTMRRKIWEEDHRTHALSGIEAEDEEDEEAHSQAANFNTLIREEDPDVAKSRRLRWLSQICEYWPLRRLAGITDSDVDNVLNAYTKPSLDPLAPASTADPTSVSTGRKPAIILAGSGPGSPLLLTVATHRAIQAADVILADKLVPAQVLDLIPRRTPVHIARKFPGNADAAQQELLDMGLEALEKGKTVLRLKQGDPYVYGRGGEEYIFFREHGYTPIVLPGVTSSLSAPLFSAIPATHRGVADQILICTGTGRKGAATAPIPYVKTQTVVFLMALHRLSSLVSDLTLTEGPEGPINPVPWPKTTPCAVIERASCPDQRIVRTTLEHVVSAVDEEGSRPPGLLVVGKSCEVLKSPGARRWLVEEGFQGFGDILGPVDEMLAPTYDTTELPVPIKAC